MATEHEVIQDDRNGVAREPERKRITGLSRVQWWRKERAGEAPRRIELGPHSVGWRRGELYDWVKTRPRK